MPPSFVRFAACLSFALAIAASVRAQGSAPAYREGEVLLKFTASAPASYRTAVLSELGATDVKELGRQKVVRVRIAGLSVDAAVARYSNRPGIEYIEPNYIYKAVVTPDDPLFGQLWGLHNTGQSGGLPGADVHAIAAWNLFTGSRNIVVGVIDTGIDYNHPDLVPNIWTNPDEIPGNGIDDDRNGYVDDVHGYDFVNDDGDPMDDHSHGTHCAGTIGAVGNNALGVAGVNWNVRLMALKFLDSGGFGTTEGAILAVDYATAMGADLTSNSWGGGDFSTPLLNSIRDADDAGILFVAAAGNSSSNNDVFPHYPSSYDAPNVIAVAATDRNDRLAWFSSYGAATVDLAAPGVDILSTTPGAQYQLKSGTSMATPHVAGALALILGRYPGIPAADARALLLAGVDPLPALAGRCVTGGRLNILQPINEPDSLPPGTITDLAVTEADGDQAGLRWTATGDDGPAGRATAYEIRYSTAPIDADNFATGALATGAPEPAPAGTAEHMTVRGLAFATSYYFALRARDEVGHVGAISNLATAQTLGPPDVSVSPSSVSGDLLTGQTSTVPLVVSNTGEGTLRFEVEIADPGVAAAAPGAAGAGAARVHTMRVLSRLRPGAVPEPTAPAPGYSDGHAPARAALLASEIRIPALPARFGMRVLLAWSGGSPVEMQTLLGAFTDVAAVDVFNLAASTPALQDLLAYDGVLVAADNAIPNAGEFGDVLADYADRGGSVVLTLASFISGFEIGGRLVTGNYMPFTLGTGPVGASSLGTFDAGHAIMQGVTGASGDLLGSTAVAPGARLVASWANGLPCVATQGTSVSALNLFVAVPGYWSGDVPLLVHNALAWGARRTGWLTADPSAAIVPGGATLTVALALDATGLNGGDYDALARLVSNDPDEPRVDVPVHLHVTGAPDILVSGEPVSAESVQEYAQSGASTTHSLTVGIPPPGGGSLEVTADGDYGQSTEFATVTADGRTLGTVGPTTLDCTPARRTFQLSAALLAELAADGTIEVTVQNTAAVGVFCEVNQHHVRLTYPVAADSIDFGTQYIGGCKPRTLVITNAGTDVLTVGSIAVDNPVFALSASSLTLPPGTSEPLVVSFCPQDAAVEVATLSVQSDDPDEGLLHVALRAEGRVAPDIAVHTDSLQADLLSGETAERTLTIANTGGSPLLWSATIEILPPAVAGSAPWLTVDPAAGTVAPGDSLGVRVRFDTAGLLGGIYAARILITSDDPNENPVIVGASLHVIGVPRIALSSASLDFGVVFVGASATRSLTVSNPGTDVLHVSQITLADSVFHTTATPFDLAVGQTRNLLVQFAPTSAVTSQSSLVLTTDDPDAGAVTVALAGEGRVPPNIAIAEDSLHADAAAGGTVTRSFTITNSQGPDLEFKILVTPPGGAAPPATGAAGVLLVQDRAPAGAAVNEQILAANGIAFDQIGSAELAGTNLLAYPLVIVAGDQSTPFYMTIAGRAAQIDAYVVAGGVLEFHAAAGGSSPGNSALVTLPGGMHITPVNPYTNDVLIASHPLVAGVPDPIPLFPSLAAFTSVPAAATRIVADEAGAPNLVTYPFGSGLVIASGQRLEEGFVNGRSVGRIITHMIPYANHQAQWLRAAPVSGRVPAGTSLPVDVTFDATSLDGGEHELTIHVLSNDPDTPDLPLAATFHVTPPDADANPNSVSLHLPPDASTSRTFTLANTAAGGAPLYWRIDVLQAPPLTVPWLQVHPLAGGLAGGASQSITLEIAAFGLSFGDFAAHVVVSTNDPDEPSIDIPVVLHVASGPHLEVAPAALDFGTVYIGYPVLRNVVATNVGSQPLTVTSVAAGLPGFAAGPGQFTLAPGASQQVAVFAFPTQPGERSTTLVFSGNDPQFPLTVPLYATALAAPDIAGTPAAVDRNVTHGRTLLHSLQICNTGASELRVQGVGIATGAGPGAQPAAMGTPAADRPTPAILGGGGPDAFGYSWTDSDDPAGPLFQWTDISTTGTAVPFASFADDVNLGPFPIGFSFPFYGNVFSTFRVCTNGFVSFTSGLAVSGNRALPAGVGNVPENLLAPFWDDLWHVASAGSRVLYQSDDARCIIQFNNMVRANETAPYGTFQIILHSSGDITYQYKALNTTRTSATVGLQNQAGDDGLTVAFNASYLHPNLAVRFRRPALDWLQISPAHAAVPPGGCATVKLAFDASTLALGDHGARLYLTSNDPDESSLVVPVTLHVTAELGVEVATAPQVLDLSARDREVTVFVEPPPPLTPADVVLASVRVNGIAPRPDTAPVVGDHDGDSVADLALRIDPSALGRTMWDADPARVVVSGDLADGQGFRGEMPLPVLRHRVLAPNGGEQLRFDSPVLIRWEVPPSWSPDHAEILWSAGEDAGWTVIATPVQGTQFAWTPPQVAVTNARVRVVLYDAEGVFSQDTSDGAFLLGPAPTDVAASAPPARTALFQNRPNPFNPTTTIGFDLATAAVVRLAVYDVTGVRIRNLVDGWRAATHHEVVWDGRDAGGHPVRSGLYFYRFDTAGHSETRRMLLIK